jgi:4-methylaminobutanoate oxidase (formaldehyde-forming)
VTEPIEGLPPNLPTLRDKDSLLYYKQEVGGLVMGGYERDGIPWAVNCIPRGFTQELLEPDFDHFEPLSQAAVKRTPCLNQAGIARLVNGPEAFTPDGNCMLGPTPEVENCFAAVGFNAFGIAAGGGAGRTIAEWIIEGEPSLNLWPLDIRRFGAHHRSQKYNVERTKEIYGKHYTMSWPYEEHDSARGIKRSPLYGLLKEKGAVYGSKFGWERANWFAPRGVKAEDELTFGIPNWFARGRRAQGGAGGRGADRPVRVQQVRGDRERGLGLPQLRGRRPGGPARGLDRVHAALQQAGRRRGGRHDLAVCRGPLPDRDRNGLRGP